MVGITINTSSDKKLNSSNEKGFTLLEVLASLVLLGILSTSVVAIFVPAANWVQQARQQTTASNYASTVLDNLRANRDKVNEENSGNSANDDEFNLNVDTRDGMTDTITVEEFSEMYNLYKVSVTINYNQGALSMCTVIRGEGAD